MNIYYGIRSNKIDVTDICLDKLIKNNVIYIPSGDLNRSALFTDPIYGVHKYIIILNNNVLTEYDEFTELTINIIDKINELDKKLTDIHNKLQIRYGSFKEELPEQKMVVRYLKGHEKVLEIGGNIGRNSLVIAYILDNPSNFVTLESDVNIAEQLRENMVLNSLNFHIESSALSNRTLIQSGWNTIPSEVYKKVISSLIPLH